MSETSEGRGGAARIEAFSDGVIAIIITIMVLELKAPEEPGLFHLKPLWPVFLAYMLSYAYVAVYWVNHHRMFAHATHVTNALLWSNMALLFALSLVPFATAYLGEQHFSQPATTLYMCVMMFPSFAYAWLQSVVRRTGKQDDATIAYHQRTQRKGALASILYAFGIALSLVSPWAGLACAAIVALLWFLPASPIDRLFGE